MANSILITGSEGLIGTALCVELPALGLDVRRFDLRRHNEDVLDLSALRVAARDCIGIIHLAAVSRVIWGEKNPKLCWQTNVVGTRNVLDVAKTAPHKPWVILASSREVYGHAAVLPATEDAPLIPCNVYGRSKVAAEELCMTARTQGVQVAVVRLSNVYGSVTDHADRVVPCFARSAATGLPLRVDGRNNTFDFTHLLDTARGLLGVVACLRAGERALPPVHLLTGQPTTLEELATLAIRLGGGRSHILDAPPRAFDVSRFYGCPDRARKLLHFTANIQLKDGLEQLMHELAKA
ncbi:MAG TPA: NAD(P)-dependent oxidoreductase [Pseudomonadota bacterium]|nr:NAD(P)-dependent oxidoreductase [Pseudomonadota bacterium]